MFNKLKNWATRYMTKKIVSKACDLAAEQQIVYGPLVISCGRQLLLSVIEKTKQDPEVARNLANALDAAVAYYGPELKSIMQFYKTELWNAENSPSMKDALEDFSDAVLEASNK